MNSLNLFGLKMDMETLIVRLENKEQLSDLKALKISFKKKETENYNPHFI